MAEQRGGRAWRSAFQPLRIAAQRSSVVPQLLSEVPVLLHSCQDLPSHEVALDIVLLVGTVTDRWLPLDAGGAHICWTVCNLVIELSTRLQLEFKTHSLLVLLQFFQETIKSALKAAVLEEEGGIHFCKAKHEALAALAQVVHDNGGQLPVEEVSSLVNFLLGLVMYHKPPSWSQNSRLGSRLDTGVWVESKFNSADDEREFQMLAFVSIGNIFTRAGPSVSKETWRATVQVLRNVLEMLASKTPLKEDPSSSRWICKELCPWCVELPQLPFSLSIPVRALSNFGWMAATSNAFSHSKWMPCFCQRYYASLLRSVSLVLSEPKGSHQEHVAAYIGVLRMFFTYGLHGSRSGGTLGNTGKEVGAYRPPHLRIKLKSQAQANGTGNSEKKEMAGGWEFSSDSEQSDSDGIVGDGDRYKSSKARTNAILAIQALARADPKSLHAHWALLLPTHDVLQPSLCRPYQATLLTTVLFDPIVKARVAAASTIAVMLEGPVRAFLQVAEHQELARKGPFTTLSGSLGQTVIQLHSGLVQVVWKEKQSSILVGALKALSLLVAAAPYNRLPTELLPNVIISVSKRIEELFHSSVDQTHGLSAALSCLGAALSATPASSEVAAILIRDTMRANSGSARQPSLLVDLISYTQAPAISAIRIEAFQALKAAVHNYRGVVTTFWHPIFKVVAGVIDTGKEGSFTATEDADGTLPSFARGVYSTGYGQNPKVSDEKLVHSALKLLDELLRVISDFEVPNESPEEGPLKPPSPSVIPKPMKLLTAPTVSTECISAPLESVQCEEVEYGCLQWLEALEYLPCVLVHTAPMVRGAALTCFAGLTSTVFSELPPMKQELIQSAVMHASQNDDTPAVRSAACRAIGVIVGFPQVSTSNEKVTQMINLVFSAMEDASASVRITAAWALANFCDALRSNVETASPQEAEQILDRVPLAHLAECTFKAAKDGDKVRANAVRALGNMARFVNFNAELFDPRSDVSTTSGYSSNGHHTSQLPASQWLGKMVQTFVSCVTTGNVKVQWNVCHALGNLFLNPTIQLPSMAWAPSVFSILLLLLRGSANYKIRIHAASALAVPASREDYGVAYGDVVQTLVHTLDSVDLDRGAGPTSFKYQSALTHQLTLTALHVLALGSPDDFNILKDVLVRRAGFLHNWLSKVVFSMERSLPVGDGTFPKEAFGASTAGGAMTSSTSGRSLAYDEKPLPLPGDQKGYGSEAHEVSYAGAAIARKFDDAERAVRALSAMYMYGGSLNTSQNFRELIA